MEIPDELVEQISDALEAAAVAGYNVAENADEAKNCDMIRCKLGAIRQRTRLEHEQQAQEAVAEKREHETLLLAAFLQLPLSILNEAIDGDLLGGFVEGMQDATRAIESGLVAMYKAGLPKPTGALGVVLEQLQDEAQEAFDDALGKWDQEADPEGQTHPDRPEIADVWPLVSN